MCSEYVEYMIQLREQADRAKTQNYCYQCMQTIVPNGWFSVQPKSHSLSKPIIYFCSTKCMRLGAVIM